MADQQAYGGGVENQGVIEGLGGPETDQAMTRSEERLVIGTTRRPVEVVRVSKRIVTEQRTITVAVRHEELVVERFPVTGDPATGATVPPMSGPAPTEDRVLVLSREEPVVTMRTVPVERVTVGVTRIAEQRTVNETVRKERIDVERLPAEGAGAPPSPTPGAPPAPGGPPVPGAPPVGAPPAVATPTEDPGGAARF